MPQTRARAQSHNAAVIDQLAEKLQQAEIAVLTEYRGLSVVDLQDLRGRLRPVGVDYVVAKNTLARFAAERSGRDVITADLVGPTAIAFGADPVGTARALQEYARINRTFVLKSALLGDRRLTAAEVDQLASLPSIERLRGQTFAMIVGPLQQAVSVLLAPLAGLARVLEARREQLAASAGEAGSEEGGDMATVDELVQNLGDLKVLDLANLVKQLEERWGVSAAAVAAPAAAAPSGDGAGAGAAAPVEEQTEFNVVLQNFGAKKIEVIKVVRELTSLGLKEAKDLVEAAPKPVLEGVARDAADSAADRLRSAGATVDVT